MTEEEQAKVWDASQVLCRKIIEVCANFNMEGNKEDFTKGFITMAAMAVANVAILKGYPGHLPTSARALLSASNAVLSDLKGLIDDENFDTLSKTLDRA